MSYADKREADTTGDTDLVALHHRGQTEAVKLIPMQAVPGHGETVVLQTAIDKPAAKRIYVSGGITGIPRRVYRAHFAAAEEFLRSRGWEVVNPTNLEPEGDCACLGRVMNNHLWSCYMKRDIHELTTCHAIYMLNEWQGSHGARFEHQVAAACGLALLYEARREW